MAERVAVVDGVAGYGEVAVFGGVGVGVFDGAAPGVRAAGARVGDLGGDADQCQQMLLVGVETVVGQAGPGGPGAEGGGGGGDEGGGVEGLPASTWAQAPWSLRCHAVSQGGFHQGSIAASLARWGEGGSPSRARCLARFRRLNSRAPRG